MSRTYLFCTIVVLLSCKTSNLNLFSSKNLHEQYGRKLATAGLKETALGQAWFAAAAAALRSPQQINLPHKEVGYFPADKPRAVGLRFAARRGQKISFQLSRNPQQGFTVFMDLWRVSDQNEPTLVSSLDTSSNSLEHEVQRDGSLILRLQPELLRSGDYTLLISTGPSLAYPVAHQSAKIGSFWGDPRDEGGRRHEGIDIFAPRGAPVVAAAEGVISSVTENNLGGKVVFLRPKGKDYSLYYAHLDQQTVNSGQLVKAGDQVGTVGNTGNARTTAPHLHLGVYTSGGAIDPLPFVDPVVKRPPNVSIDPETFKMATRTRSSLRVEGRTVPVNSVAYPFAASAKELRVQFPDGSTATIPASNIEPATTTIKSAKTRDSVSLLEAPVPGSPKVAPLRPAAEVKVRGYFLEFAFVEAMDGSEGWVRQSDLR